LLLGIFEHLLDSFRFDLLSPLDQARRTPWQFMLEVFVTAEASPAGILNSLLYDRLVAFILSVFEIAQRRQQSRRRAGPHHFF
jgi:hypothetical protein